MPLLEFESQENLGYSALKGLKQNPLRTVLVDRTGLKRKEMKAAALLAAGAYLAEKLKIIDEQRIGIVLPPGSGGMIANLAVALAGKVSVNLNFIVPPETAQNTMEAAGVKTVITVAAMQTRLKNFPWPTNTVDIVDVLGSVEAKRSLRHKFFQALLLPTGILAREWGIAKIAEGEATLVFSSGSTGTPKGIPLTHRNLQANLAQIGEIKNLLLPGSRLFSALPLFHSFGLTISVWYALTHPIRVISYPSPLEAEAVGQIVREEGANIMIGSPQLYRIYLRQVPVEDFKSLHNVVAGADKTPKGLHERWKQHFGSEYLEGYGLTETSPVASVNEPGRNKIGTTGQILKGMEARITDPETGEVLPTSGANGMIELKGPNVFSGYLNSPELNAEKFHDGWFRTGDFGNLEPDGTLRVEGRLERFSKVGGEKISHRAIEEAIAGAYGWEENGSFPIAVTGIVDEKKGEEFVVLSTIDLDAGELRKKLLAAQVPNLWIPRKVVRVEAIPHLPSGKLDLRKLKELATG